MTKLSELPVEEQERMEAAAAWCLHLRETPALEFGPEFLDWISEPQNAKAYHAVERGWSELEEFASSPAVVDMRRAALGRIRQLGIKRLAPRRFAWAATAALFVLACAGGLTYDMLTAPQDFRTGAGERRIFTLSDGSRVSMDSDTTLMVRYTKSGRFVTLDHGRARFDVAHDTTRPFAVAAGRETVIAVGTSFDVERLGPKILVTLIQGHIVVKNAPEALRPALRPVAVSLNAGQMLVAEGAKTPAISPANLQAASAWEAGHLVFKDETLGEAVARINRYTDQPVSVDPAVASIRISGVFNAGDVGSFVSAVTSLLPVQATTTSDNMIFLQKRS